MTGVSLDTSGAVEFDNDPMPGMATYIMWDNLTPFERGYVEAMFASMPSALLVDWIHGGSDYVRRRIVWSDLAPETLAAIRKDCAARKADWGAMLTRQEHGRQFLEERQRGDWGNFPPLTVTLGDDGKVRIAPVDGTTERLSRSGRDPK